MNGLWNALLTSSTSIINEGKGKVFVKAVFLLGSPSRLFYSMSGMNQESEEFRDTQIPCSVSPSTVEGGRLDSLESGQFLRPLEGTFLPAKEMFSRGIGGAGRNKVPSF